MADLFQWWNQDLTILPDGDLLLVGGVQKSGLPMPGTGTIEGEQRVIRRLLTAAGSYIWNPEYGAGLPQYIGQPAHILAIQSIIMAQIMLEDAVAKSPLPIVTISKILNGLSANIRYVDNNIGKQVTVGFDINA
jgi:hypothetical protein